MFVSRFLISLASELREKNIYPFSYSSPLHMLSIWFFMKITARVKQMAAVSPHEEPRIRGFLTRLAVLFGDSASRVHSFSFSFRRGNPHQHIGIDDPHTVSHHGFVLKYPKHTDMVTHL